MWTPTTRRHHSRARLGYETDPADTEWAVIGSLMPEPASCRRMREIFNAIFYVLRGGITWRLDTFKNLFRRQAGPNQIKGLARAEIAIWEVFRGVRLILKDLPPRSTTYGYSSRWRDEGLLVSINHHLPMADRERVRRDASPSAAVLDS